MAATVLLREFNDANTANATDKSGGSVRFKSANNATVDLNNPIVRPAGADVFSYEKYLRLKVTVAPAGSITSPVAYSDGANGLGGGIGVKAKAVGAFAAPINTESPATASLFTYTSGSPLAIDATNVGPYVGTGDIADFLVLQASVGAGASPGLASGETLTVSWSET